MKINFKKDKALELLNMDNEFYDTKEYNYRNKVTLHVNDDKIGFYQEKYNDIKELDILECYEMQEEQR